MPNSLAWLAHTLQYLILTLWFCGMSPQSRYLAIGAALLLLGIAVEVMQAASIFRTFDLKDILANAIGVATGLLLASTALRHWCHRAENRLLRLQ